MSMGEALPKKSSGKVRRNERVIYRFSGFMASSARMFASVNRNRETYSFHEMREVISIELAQENSELMTTAIDLRESYFSGVGKGQR